MTPALAERAGEVAWWHSIDLGGGLVTAGVKTPEILAAENAALRLPDLRGKTVLDVGAWDGYYSFLAERAGAARVVALDFYTWSVDLHAFNAYRAWCAESGETPRAPHELPELWHPDQLPGKRGFDLAREALSSSVEPLVADLTTLDAAALGAFDVVLCLGVLYHLEDPLGGCRQLHRLTREVAVVESEAIHAPGLEDVALWRFHGVDHLGGGPGNWWVPNRRALDHVLLAAGFSGVGSVGSVGFAPDAAGLTHSRAVVHAWP